MKIDNALFKKLLDLKNEGYTYITSCRNDHYTDYDQAVQDSFEMNGNEPSYGDWVKESLQGYGIGKYVSFHNGFMIIGDYSTRYYDTESFDLVYKNEILPSYLWEMIDDNDARYVDLIAYAIWHLNFKRTDQRIDSIDEYNNIYSTSEKIYNSLRIEESGDSVKTLFVNDELWEDTDFIIELLKLNEPAKIVLSFLPETFKQNNKEFYKNLFKEDPSVFQFCPEEMRSNKEIVISAVSHIGISLEFASEELKADRDIVTAAITNDANAFSFIAHSLKSDPDIYRIYIGKLDVKWDTNTLEYLSEVLKGNKEFIKSLVSLNGFVLKDLSQEFKNDKEIVMSAINQNGGALKYASQELKADKEIVISAVSNPNIKDIYGNPGRSLQYASDDLKGNKEIVLRALANKSHMNHSRDETLSYISDSLKADRDVVMAAVSNDGNALENAADKLKLDKDIVKTAISCEGLSSWAYCIKHALKEFNTDKEIVMAMVTKIGDTLEYASDKFKSDKEIVMAAVSNYGSALEFASDILKSDKELVLVAVSNEGGAVKNASDELKADKDVAMAAVKQNG